MSEITKCPICGEEPLCPPALNIEEMHPDSVECCGVVAFTKELWNQYAAAMELARATRTLEDAMEPLNAGKLKMGAALPAIRLAMKDAKACEARVLEVFK